MAYCYTGSAFNKIPQSYHILGLGYCMFDFDVSVSNILVKDICKRKKGLHKEVFVDLLNAKSA